MPIVQINNSLSAKAGTLRGMHYQLPPAAEIKVVRCIRGALYDVIIDLRPDSPTFGKWFGVELTAENRLMMYVPQGFAHGIHDADRRHRSVLSGECLLRARRGARHCASTIRDFGVGLAASAG